MTTVCNQKPQRARERERERECACVYVRVCVCVCEASLQNNLVGLVPQRSCYQVRRVRIRFAPAHDFGKLLSAHKRSPVQ